MPDEPLFGVMDNVLDLSGTRYMWFGYVDGDSLNMLVFSYPPRAAAMFREAAAFMGLMEHRHTRMVSTSAAGWERYIPVTPSRPGRIRRKGIRNSPCRIRDRNSP